MCDSSSQTTYFSKNDFEFFGCISGATGFLGAGFAYMDVGDSVNRSKIFALKRTIKGGAIGALVPTIFSMFMMAGLFAGSGVFQGYDCYQRRSLFMQNSRENVRCAN